MLVVLLLQSCENDLAEVQKVVQSDEANTELARDVELLYSDSAIVRVRIKGPRMIRHLERNNPWEEFPDGIEVDVFNSVGSVQGKLTAKYAVRYQDKREVIASDSVVWQSLNEERLETEKLIWDEKGQRVFSKSFCKITKPDEVIFSHGFEANEDFTHWKLNAIEGKLKVEGIDQNDVKN
ncbi:MAG: LPS export ABC transporter periplasmic protein LptC [Bacteroidota bacterium]